MELTGKLIVKNETQSFGANGFEKREFVVEYADNPQYPEYIKFELVQDKCRFLDNFNINDLVFVKFNLKGRKWTNPKGEEVYFNSLQAWFIEAAQQPSDLTPERDQAIKDSNNPDWLNPESEESDGLPF